MRIRVRRTGGFAGIERSAEVEVSGPEWESLASAVLAAAEATRVVPDGFSYEITVDGRTVRCADPHLTDAQRTLVTRVLKEGA
ncbi:MULTISPECIES: protealysin inhibitor emfourin [unclassified Streptomyces]|uniref:protealysin inhibitor emfourin n=1 Tax=unclassified Streptomyces TaxID=2593676 RepID=UPI0004CAB35E|nr:protealysin inhibitor emfourin [Streptomyces sp. NRRL F-5727]